MQCFLVDRPTLRFERIFNKLRIWNIRIAFTKTSRVCRNQLLRLSWCFPENLLTVHCFYFVSGEPGGRLVEFYKSRKDQLGLSLTAGPNNSLSISYIQPGSAAGKAPLRIGDRVITVNGTAIQDLSDAQVCFVFFLYGIAKKQSEGVRFLLIRRHVVKNTLLQTAFSTILPTGMAFIRCC